MIDVFTTRKLALALASVCAAATLSLTPGCNIVGPAYYAIHGPEKVEAAYKLDPNASTLVLVDDPASKVGRRRLRADIAVAATETMLAKGLVTDMIDSRPALVLATKQTDDGTPMSISEIGQAVDADVVIYALLTEFTLSSDGTSNMPSATVQVKVLDANTGERLWPEDPRGETVRLRPEYRSGDLAREPGEALESERALAARMGLAIAQLFYKHEVTDSARR